MYTDDLDAGMWLGKAVFILISSLLRAPYGWEGDILPENKTETIHSVKKTVELREIPGKRGSDMKNRGGEQEKIDWRQRDWELWKDEDRERDRKSENRNINNGNSEPFSENNCQESIKGEVMQNDKYLVIYIICENSKS